MLMIANNLAMLHISQVLNVIENKTLIFNPGM